VAGITSNHVESPVPAPEANTSISLPTALGACMAGRALASPMGRTSPRPGEAQSVRVFRTPSRGGGLRWRPRRRNGETEGTNPPRAKPSTFVWKQTRKENEEASGRGRGWEWCRASGGRLPARHEGRIDGTLTTTTTVRCSQKEPVRAYCRPLHERRVGGGNARTRDPQQVGDAQGIRDLRRNRY